MHILTWLKRDKEDIAPSITLLFGFTIAALLGAKALISPGCIPRYPDVAAWNGVLIILVAGGIYGILRFGEKAGIIIETVVSLAVVSYLIYEVRNFLPFVHTGTPPLGIFLLLSILVFSVLLSYIALYRHIAAALVCAGIEALYITLLMERLRNESVMLYIFLLFHVVFLLVLFRGVKIIRIQRRRTAELLEEQQKLNQRLSDSTRRLVEQEKLLILAKTGEGLSHEINNPLTYLMGNLYFLRNYTEEAADSIFTNPAGTLKRLEQLKELYRDYEHGLSQIKRVVDQLGFYSRHSTNARGWFDLYKLLTSCIEIKQSSLDGRPLRKLERSFSIEFEGSAEVWIFGYSKDFVSICSNLLDIAVDLVEGSKVVTITLEQIDTTALLTIGGDRLQEVINRAEKDEHIASKVRLCKTIIEEYGGEMEMTATSDGEQIITRLPCGVHDE